MKAKDVLLTGIEKFPKNERILDGLMQLYTSEQGIGDPADLIALIDKAIQDNPSNVDLWFGRGRIFYALKDYDQSIDSFKKVVELKPDLFEGNYYLGVFYTIKGDGLNKEMNEKQYSSQSVYDADLKGVNDVYMAAIPWFEKAHQIKPDDVDTLEFLKSICFRLRDEPGIMDKYNTYNALYKQVKGIESLAFLCLNEWGGIGFGEESGCAFSFDLRFLSRPGAGTPPKSRLLSGLAGDAARDGAAGQLLDLRSRELVVVARDGVFQRTGSRAEVQCKLHVAGMYGHSVNQSAYERIAHADTVDDGVDVVDARGEQLPACVKRSRDQVVVGAQDAAQPEDDTPAAGKTRRNFGRGAFVASRVGLVGGVAGRELR